MTARWSSVFSERWLIPWLGEDLEGERRRVFPRRSTGVSGEGVFAAGARDAKRRL